MSIRHERVYFVRCDTCGTEDHDTDVRSAYAARIAAGGQREWDYCPECKSGNEG